MTALPPPILLMGPTASGKSALALALARRWPAEIISVDSAQVYRGMDIGTAKPSAAEREAVPHHLLDLLDPAEAYSAARFCTDAARLIGEIRSRGRVPILVGGTMLYFRALTRGLNALPSADPTLRRELEARARREGWPALHAQLARVDAATAARLHPHDQQRIQRALEIHALSGIPASDWHARSRSPAWAGPCVRIILELEPRTLLHQRIAERFARMMEAGLLEEVRALHARSDLHPGLPAIRSVGYRQLWAYLDGSCTLEQAVEQAVAASRQLAKRQLTWLKSEIGALRLDARAADLPEQVLNCLDEPPVLNTC